MTHASGYFYLKSMKKGPYQPHSWRWVLLTLAPLAAPLALYAQAPPLTGTVVEAGTGKPIPFATIELPARHLGVQATEAGTFVLTLPASLNPTDSLRVASLGFAPRMLALPKTTPYQLELTALAVSLTEVMVRPSTTKPVRLGPEEDGDRFGFGNGKIQAMGSSGWQIAREFTDGPAGTIQAVLFYVRPNVTCGRQSVQAPFRVRVYAADGPGRMPGTDLLITSVLTAATKKGWHEVDLTKFQLRTPDAGFYVAMEWLYTSDTFGCEYTATMQATKEKRTNYSYGQTLGGYIDEALPATWYLTAGHVWQQIPRRELPGNRINRNAAIQAVIQPD